MTGRNEGGRLDYAWRMSIALDQLPAEEFDDLVGQPLVARLADGKIELLLESVWRSPYPTARALPGFSLFLRGPLQQALGQGIIGLQHPRHGELLVFMTPVGRDARGLRYEVVFN